MVHRNTPIQSSQTSRAFTRVLSAACAVTLAVITGCATVDNRPTEEIVGERVQARLDALLAWDFETAIQYNSPGYRETYGVAELKSAYYGARNWHTAEFYRADCEGPRCEVTVIVDYEIKRPPVRNKKPIVETWVQIDDEWFISLKK